MLKENKPQTAENTLGHVLRMMRTFFDGVDELVYVLDPDRHELVFVNQKFKQVFGEKTLGQKCYSVMHNMKQPCAFCTNKNICNHGIGKAYAEEVQNQRNKRWYRCIGKSINWHDGRLVLLEMAIDITAHKQIEEALQKSEELFRLVVENSHDGILIIDDKFKIVYANEECTRMFGYPTEKIVGKDFRNSLDKETRTLIKNRYLQRQRGEKVPSCYEIKVARKDGTEGIIEVKATVTRDSQDKVRTIAQILDVTDRKRMENERKYFEERLSALNRYGQSLNMAKSLDEMYLAILEAMEKILGFEYASILMIEGKLLKLKVSKGYSKQLSVNLHLDEEKGVTVKVARIGESVLVPDIRKEDSYVLGKPGMLSELAVPIKLGDKILGILNVESDRLSAFDEKDRECLEILASHAAIAISNMKSREKLGLMSKRLEELMKNSARIMHTRETHQRLKAIASAIEEFGWRRVVISLRNENLESIDLVTAGLNEEEIKVLMARKAPNRVWRERLGPKFERFKIGEFYYLPWSDSWVRENVHGIPPDTEPEEPTTYAGVPSSVPEEEMVDWHPQDMLYAPLRTPDGKIVGILSMDDPVDGRKPTRKSLTSLGIFLHQAAMVIENAQLIENLKETRKQLEAYTGQLERKVEERTRELEESQEQLLKAQRMAVIGELAGMVGHDLRNPLTSINGATYYVKKKLGSDTDGKILEMLELIEKNIVHSNKIINDLLDYSREIRLDFAECTPKTVIDESLSLLEIPEDVQVINIVGDKLKIKVDVEKLKRAFINLIKNAVEAMPEGGTLTIKSRKLDGNIEFLFSDTGIGMAKETVKKLWSPLFTTKAKGMGFGLAICKRIIEAHGGFISVESTPGKGTTFVVILPIEQRTKGGENTWVKTLESSLSTMTRTSEKYW